MIYSTPINTGPGWAPGEKLIGLSRCPHCTVANPNMNRVWHDYLRGYGDTGWAAYRCNSCRAVLVGIFTWTQEAVEAMSLWPEAKTAHEDIPELARTYLQQAFETLHAPDAAAVMAGSAVDAMLKHLGYSSGSLYTRIDEALQKNLLTKGMADWAHTVRLESNRPRHADAERPNVTREEARQSVDFAEALGNFLFVLTARIERGIKAAREAENDA
ncbi:hypothetical protein ACSSVZ_001176 [Amorphus sp. MBR-141]